MKTLRLFFLLVLLGFALFRPVWNVKAQKSVLSMNSSLEPCFNSTLDDFNDGNGLNNWLYNTYAGGTGGTCQPSFAAGAYEGPFCLRLDYSVPSPGDFSWYASKLGRHNAHASNFNGLTFWVKGAAGGETLKLELKTANCNTVNRSNASLYVNDFLPGYAITTAWQQAVIPFKNFANITNFSRLEELTFVFEHDWSGTNGSPFSGAVFLDRIRFTNQPGGFSIVRQDYASDRIFRNALGGNMGWGGGSRGHASAGWSGGEYRSAPYSLKMEYNVASNSSAYAFVYSLFGGGKSGNSLMQCNFSNYTYLTFWTRTDGVTTNVQLQVEMDVDDAWPPYWLTCAGIRSNWQYYMLPLTNFREAYGTARIDKRKIAKLVFTMTYGKTPAADRRSAIYFDDIKFQK